MIDNQIEILNKLSFLVYSTHNIDYDYIIFTYKFDTIEEWSSFAITQVKNEKNYPPNEFNSFELKKYCKKLHSEMQKHTGGDWRKFSLTIFRDGSAKTEFSYEPQSYLDDID